MATDFEEAESQAKALLNVAIEELRKPLQVPSFKGVSLEPLRADISRAKTTRKETNRTIDEERTRVGQVAQQKKEAIDAAAQAETAKSRAEQEKAQKIADIHTQLAEAMRVRPEDIAAVGVQLRAETAKAQQSLAKVQQMQSVGLLDDPLQFLANQIQLPSAAQAHNRQVDVVNSLAIALDNALKLQEEAALSASKGIPAITTAQAKAQQDAAFAAATFKKAEADEKLAAENVRFATQKLSQDLAIANLGKDFTQLQLSKATQLYSAQLNAIQLAENHTQRLLKAAELVEKIANKEGLKPIFAAYDRMVGNPVGTTNLRMFELMKPEDRHNIITIASGTYGSNAYEAMKNIERTNVGPLFPDNSRALWQWLNVKATGIETSIKTQGIDEKQKARYIGTRLEQEIETAKREASTPGSPFYELSPRAMLQSGAVPQGSKLAEALKPFANRTDFIPTEDVLAAIRTAFPNANEAGIVTADLYTRNMKLRNELSNSKAFRITLPDSYLYTVRGTGNLFTKSMVIDLTKPSEAIKFFLLQDLKKVREAMASSQIQGTAGTEQLERLQSRIQLGL